MTAIFKRELRSFSRNMTGPIFIAAFIALAGIYFTSYNLIQGYPHFSAVLSGVSVVFLLTVPIITMRSFAEEKRTRTDQLLLTSPVSITEIVMGKYLAMVSLLAACCLITCIAPVVLRFYGADGMLSDYLAILEFFLMGSAYLSIGMFISTLTENQIISAVCTFFILLILQMADGIASLMPDTSVSSLVCLIVLIILAGAILTYITSDVRIGGGAGLLGIIITVLFFVFKKESFEGLLPNIFASVSLISRFDDILNQSLNLSAAVYYITICALFVFLSVQSIRKRRWS